MFLVSWENENGDNGANDNGKHWRVILNERHSKPTFGRSQKANKVGCRKQNG